MSGEGDLPQSRFSNAAAATDLFMGADVRRSVDCVRHAAVRDCGERLAFDPDPQTGIARQPRRGSVAR